MTADQEKQAEESQEEKIEVIEYDFGSIKPEEYYINLKQGQQYEFDDADF